MPDAASNVEFAREVTEHGLRHPSNSGRRSRWVEIAEAVVLAIVAVATAWSSYQAAKWDALSAQDYNLASSTTVRSQAKSAMAGQDRLYDTITFNGWALAKTSGNEKLVKYYERRFRPEYATAFAAWIVLDPFNDPSAPIGPIFMPQYKSANSEEAVKLAQDADAYFQKAVSSRETGDQYVRVTVFLATVLLLTALGQRFEINGPRVTVLVVACILLIISTLWLLTFPRV
jgi:hypothetical protein